MPVIDLQSLVKALPVLSFSFQTQTAIFQRILIEKTCQFVKEHIQKTPVKVRGLLSELQDLVIKISKGEAVENLSYGMSGFRIYGKPFVYFAAFKTRIEFYPGPEILEKVDKQLSAKKRGKGSIQFPIE